MKKLEGKTIVLASASPRRRELLAQIGLDFTVCVSTVEEKVTKSLPDQVVEELSRQKALDVYGRTAALGGRVVIGADTIVYCEGRILGKPASYQDAVEMLKLLQGRTHFVYTGVTLLVGDGGEEPIERQFFEETAVSFYPMDLEEIERYVDTGEPFDKAGGYGIQGVCARHIKGIYGDYSNVVGLPVGRLYTELKAWDAGGGKRAVLFDLDGTLSDSIASIKYCADRAVAPYGIGPFSVEQYYYFVGDGAANLVKRCLAAGGDEGLVHFEEAYARYLDLFREDCMYQVKPYEGMPEALAALKERGLKLAVLSNKPHLETIRVVEALYGKDCFDVIQGQEPGLAIKPSPDGALRVFEKLGVEAGSVLYLGDTATDMKTGKNAGAFTIGALWGFRERGELEEGGADAVIAHPRQLLWYL